jgi:phosphoenolpyruvate carboxykinase (ATP)
MEVQMTSSSSSHNLGLEGQELKNSPRALHNPTTSLLYEEAIRNGEGMVTHLGPLAVNTGKHTGRAVGDRFIVQEPSSEGKIWWGKVNKPFDTDLFDALYVRVQDYLKNKKLYIQDCFCGADTMYRLPVRVITETAWHSMFARNMFLRPTAEELKTHRAEFTVIHAPKFQAVPERDGTRSEAFIIINFARKLVLIGGTAYAGEIKKSIFSIMNYLLPQKQVMPMHCSANLGPKGDVALFFGLSGTGKTTLSADVERGLIGDDEHGWSENGVFNFEGGCYAKVIRLSKESEPQIFDCTRRFGTILENVIVDPATRRCDLDNDSLTENTRASYPITHISNAVLSGRGGHPQNVIMLTCDSFGVMPPVAKLTTQQAMYYFISGYTAKLAGTEAGLGKEPTAAFSPCFGAPFMSLHPSVYGDLLRHQIDKQHSHCWLVNTGWTGGAFGVGKRMSIGHTRKIIHAILDGSLSKAPTQADAVFGFHVPSSCPGVPAEVLNPRNTWQSGEAYDEARVSLAKKFVENFKEFSEHCTAEVRNAGPKL